MAKIIRHPDYKTDDFIFDIAILKLSKTIRRDQITSVCLPNVDESTRFEGKTATAAGWGIFKDELITWDWMMNGLPVDENYVESEPREVILRVARSASCGNATQSPSVLCASMDNHAKSACKVFLNNHNHSL